MNPLDVLLINDTAELKGGVESVMQRETDYLSERGYTVRSVGFAADDVAEPFTDDVVTESRSRIVRELSGLSVAPRIYRGIRSILDSYDPDVVHIHKSQKYPATVALAVRDYPSVKTHHDYSTVCPSAWAVKQDTLEVCECGVGAKCWQHGCRSFPVVAGYYFPKHKIQKPIERAIIDSHTAPGAELTQYITNFGYDGMQITNPQSVLETGTPEDDGFFLFVGRLTKEKGVDVLVDAVDAIAGDYPDLSVKIAGTGAYEDELRSRVDPHGPIELLGYVSEEKKQDLYSRARGVVVPSVWMEAFALVVLEAMAYAKPVLGSNRGGVKEIVNHEVTGLLHQATDADALAEHLVSLPSDPDRARELGTNGRTRLRENYGYDMFGNALEAELHDVVRAAQ